MIWTETIGKNDKGMLCLTYATKKAEPVSVPMMADNPSVAGRARTVAQVEVRKVDPAAKFK